MMHEWKSQVRDYEVDGYGGVNAATYLNYMEEARKHYLATLGFDLTALAKKNIGFIVSRYEIDYKQTLSWGDEFVVETDMVRTSRLQVRFSQAIYQLPGRNIAVLSKNFGIPIDIERNRPQWPPEVDRLLGGFPIIKDA